MLFCINLQFRPTLLMLTTLIRYLNSTNKNYTTQFKVRNRLAEFFKHIHPDQMSQAPTKIKQENLRSLKNFNAYFDAINQQKPIEGKLLKFYISEKTNSKSRRFFSFNLELPQLSAQQVQMTESKAEKLIDDIVNALNNKFKESRNIVDGKKKEKITLDVEIKEETEEERVKRMEETVGPYSKEMKKYIEQERLRSAINAKFMQSEKQHLKLKLRQNMSFADTSTNKPMMWSRLIMQESGIYNDYQKILQNLIDPKLIYFSEQIGLHEIEQFKKKLLPGQLDRLGVRATHAVLEVCQLMESYSPPISLFVTKHYSATDIPGFYSIPYNFKPVEFLSQFKLLKDTILLERQKYEQYYDIYQQMCKDLQIKNRIIVKPPTFKNNPDIANKILILQRLVKHKFDKTIHLNILEQDQYRILCREYKLPQNLSVQLFNKKIFLIPSFKQEDLTEVISSLAQVPTAKTCAKQQ